MQPAQPPEIGLRSTETMVFFGKSLSALCQKCGASRQTPRGHKYCCEVACPMALIEFKRRGRRGRPEIVKA